MCQKSNKFVSFFTACLILAGNNKHCVSTHTMPHFNPLVCPNGSDDDGDDDDDDNDDDNDDSILPG